MTINDIQTLINKDETRELELKKTTGELKDGMRSACAFLNTAGGWLVFGIAPATLQIIGQQVTDNTRREIALELGKIEPVVSLEVEYVELEDKPGFYVIVLHLDKSLFREEPYVFDGRPYYRVESTTKLMPQEMYQKLLRKKDARRKLWEEELNPEIMLEHLDEDAIWRLVRAGVEAGRIPERMMHKELTDVLKSMHLSVNGVLKNAASALFVKEEFAPIQFQLKMARFAGITKREFIDNRLSSGNIFRLYDEGMAFFFKHLNVSGSFVTGQPERVEVLTIPYLALRECLLNALAHRIYHLPNSFVSIAIYDDRVEVENSGVLPEDVTLEELLQSHSSFAHNPLIAQVMYFGKYLETWGRGIELMQEQCNDVCMPAPSFIAERGCFRVVFLRPDYGQQGSMKGSMKGGMKGGMKGDMKGGTTGGITGGITGGTTREKHQIGLSDYDLMLLDIMEGNPHITITEMTNRIGLTRRNTYEHIKKLQAKGCLLREGPDRGGVWRVLKR